MNRKDALWKGTDAAVPAALVVVAVLAGCAGLGSITEVGTGFAVATGRMTEGQAESVTRTAQAVERSFGWTD